MQQRINAHRYVLKGSTWFLSNRCAREQDCALKTDSTMMTFHLRSLLACALVVGQRVLATYAQRDWKRDVGWDGTTVDISAIGDILYYSSAADVQVCTPTLNQMLAHFLILQKRHTGGVYVCTGANWSGRCAYAINPLNACVILRSDHDLTWADSLWSFGPDACTQCESMHSAYYSRRHQCLT